MQILTFGPIIRGFGGNAFDMGAVWSGVTKKSIGGPKDSWVSTEPEFHEIGNNRQTARSQPLMADFGTSWPELTLQNPSQTLNFSHSVPVPPLVEREATKAEPLTNGLNSGGKSSERGEAKNLEKRRAEKSEGNSSALFRFHECERKFGESEIRSENLGP